MVSKAMHTSPMFHTMSRLATAPNITITVADITLNTLSGHLRDVRNLIFDSP